MEQLLWFTHGFVGMQAQRRDDGELRLVLSDLRMGLEPDYFFRYDVAGADAQGRWVAAPGITRIPDAGGRSVRLNWVWRRLRDSQAAL